MPMSMCVAHPIALAAFAVLAIGLISYTIITNKEKKIPVRKRRDKCVVYYTAETESKSLEQQGVRKRRNTNTKIKTPRSEKIESKKQDDISEKFRNDSSTSSNETHPDFSCGSSIQEEGSFNNLNSLNQNIDEGSKILNIQNINQKDSEKLDMMKIAFDGDNQSSVRNVSATNANDLTVEPMSLERQKSKEKSEVNTSEKVYKKEICECLRNEMETMSLSSHAESHLSENEYDICSLRDLDNAVENLVICRGCEERYANAVAYPCGHRYLCLDCAIKVHRIYQKCTVCNFHIKTYDIFNNQVI